MIGQFIGVLKSSVRPIFNWRSYAQNLSKSREGGEAAVVVNEDTDQSEFRVRYRNLRFTSIVTLFCMVLSFAFLAFASTLSEFLFCFFATVLFGLFYTRYAMVLWISRKCWINWQKRHNKVKITGATFLRAVLEKPGEYLPLPLSSGDKK